MRTRFVLKGSDPPEFMEVPTLENRPTSVALNESLYRALETNIALAVEEVLVRRGRKNLVRAMKAQKKPTNTYDRCYGEFEAVAPGMRVCLACGMEKTEEEFADRRRRVCVLCEGVLKATHPVEVRRTRKHAQEVMALRRTEVRVGDGAREKLERRLEELEAKFKVPGEIRTMTQDAWLEYARAERAEGREPDVNEGKKKECFESERWNATRRRIREIREQLEKLDEEMWHGLTSEGSEESGA